MRLPNGYGGIAKLSGKRRRPYMVRITMGFTDDGKQIFQILGYYATRKEALVALAEYNNNPYNPIDRQSTFDTIYEKYCQEKYFDKGEKVPQGRQAAYKWCKDVYKMPFIDLKTSAMQKIDDDCTRGPQTKKNIKILFNLLSKYCMVNNIIDKNYAQFVEVPIEAESTLHQPFKDTELNILWKYADDIDVQAALILCYTGMRPSELVLINRDDVHLSERYMTGGIKTKAGKDRIIPIAKKILPFITRLYNAGAPGGRLFIYDGQPVTYDFLRKTIFINAMKKTGLNHLPHDGRHTCATRLDNANINPTIKKRILGHASRDVTEKVYTHKTINQLIEAIDLI